MSEGMSRIVASLVRVLERPLTSITLCSRASEELQGMWLCFSYTLAMKLLSRNMFEGPASMA